MNEVIAELEVIIQDLTRLQEGTYPTSVWFALERSKVECRRAMYSVGQALAWSGRSQK